LIVGSRPNGLARGGRRLKTTRPDTFTRPPSMDSAESGEVLIAGIWCLLVQIVTRLEHTLEMDCRVQVVMPSIAGVSPGDALDGTRNHAGEPRSASRLKLAFVHQYSGRDNAIAHFAPPVAEPNMPSTNSQAIHASGYFSGNGAAT